MDVDNIASAVDNSAQALQAPVVQSSTEEEKEQAEIDVDDEDVNANDQETSEGRRRL